MKHKPLYREVLKRAWRLTREHKRLWLFGFFATFLQTSGVVEMILRAWGRTHAGGWSLENFISGAYPGAALVGTFGARGGFTRGLSPLGFVVFLAVLAIFIGLLWFISASEGALIWAVKGSGRSIPKLDKAFRGGRPFGWKIAGVHVASKIIIAFLFLLTTLPLLAASLAATRQNLALYFISFIIFFPLLLIATFVTIYAVCGIVIHNYRVGEAIHEAWQLFREHWLVSFETAIILFGVSVLGTIVAGAILTVLLIPALLLMFASALAGVPAVAATFFTLFLLLAAALVLFVGTLVTTFQLITWTQLYNRLHRHGGVPKLIRLLRSIPKLLLHRA